MFGSKKSIFDKINDYLVKKGHELVMSIYLNNYNGNNIYIRVDYVRKLSIYKVVWVDLNFLNPKKMDAYIKSQQTVNKTIKEGKRPEEAKNKGQGQQKGGEKKDGDKKNKEDEKPRVCTVCGKECPKDSIKRFEGKDVCSNECRDKLMKQEDKKK